VASEVNVPDVNGVPAVNFAPGFGIGITLLSTDIGPLSQILSPASWGIYLGGAPVIVANSTVTFEFRKEWLLLDYPVERGGFESYNKVWVPFSGRIRFASGGNFAERQALLESVKAISGDTNLYSLVMPEDTFTSCNVMHYDFNREAMSGLGMLKINVWMQEISQLGSSTFGSTANPSSQAQQNGGTVTPTDPSSSQVSAVNLNFPASPGGGGAPTPSL
jgi:hypothetical protein